VKLAYDHRAAFRVEKALIASHPNATFIRVETRLCGFPGLDACVEEDGRFIDVTAEVVAIVNGLIAEANATP
jgi:hypothetical protein